MNLNTVARVVDRASAVDPVADRLAEWIHRRTASTRIKNLLSGVAIGHPLHPILTDLPIGFLTSANALDLLGGEAAESAADLMVGLGLLTAVPTAAAGLSDWSDTQGQERRIGLVHAVFNAVGLLAFVASMVERRRDRRGCGVTLGLLGSAAMTAGGYLGGHLVFSRGVGPTRTGFAEPPGDWISVANDAGLLPGAHVLGRAGQYPVLVCRSPNGRLTVLADQCSHAGGPLHEGTFNDGCVTCPWHGSRFDLADGTVVRGPAAVAQPMFDVRVTEGRIEARIRD